MANQIEQEIDLTHNLNPEMESKLKEVFAIFDQDDSGTIEGTELKSILDAVMQEDVPMEKVNEFMETVDADRSGYIGLEEFLKLMSDCLSDKGQKDEEMVQLFKSFGPESNTDVITIG